MARGAALLFDLIAHDGASPAFLKVAGAADKAAVATARAQKGIATSGAAMARTGSKLTKSLTLPLAAVAAVSLGAAIKYQKNLNTIAVATDQSATSMAQAQKGLLKISNDTATSTDQLTESLYTAAKSGQPMAKALQTVRAAAQGAKAESADLGTVTNALTSIMASYGSKLSDPVKAMNMIVRGSGLAKTTLADFANSLSTVVPVAASLGISFDQVAGAIDTMTQHGETAQHATDNLRNLITNLAGQNNVASQSLQQLGVNTVDLSKNLGKRGLTGSLNIVLAAINRHGKDGQIVTSAFKQAGIATASLRTEIEAMPAALQKNAKAFDAGTMGYKDFLSYAKSLGGQQFQMARQFLATEGTAKGFSNTLKSGNGTVRTLASTLQKSLGGVTGMNVALQLSGESAKTFQRSVDAVGKAGAESGKNVLGFAQTQQTAAYKADQAKQALHNLAIEAGTALLPAFTKLASGLSKAVHWFDGLSGTQKKVLGWSVGILAALGPLFTIGARLAMVGRGIGTFLGGVGTRLASMAGATEATASRVAVGMRSIGAALGGAAIGIAVGSLTAKSSTAVKAIGVLGAAAAGAALGASGGPLGIAIGGLAGGLGALAAQFFGAGKAARQAIKPTDDFTNAIRADNDAVGKNTEALIANQLQKGGLYDAGLKLGISQRTLTLAAEGNTVALADVQGAIRGASLAAVAGQYANGGMTKAQRSNSDAASKLAGGLSILKTTLDVNTRAAGNIDAGLGKVAKTATGTASSLSATQRSALNAKGGFLNLGSSAQGLAANLKALGGSHSVNVDTGAARAAVDGLLERVNLLFSRILNPPSAPKMAPTSTPSTGGKVPALITGGATPKSTHARGGTVADGWFTVGEQGYELGYKRGSKVDIYSNRESQKMTGMAKVPGFAKGTTKPVTVGNTTYATKLGAQNARARIDSSKLQDTVSGIAGFLAAVRNFQSTAQDTSSAASELLKAAKAQGVGARALASFSRVTSLIVRDSKQRDAVRARLGSAPTATSAYDRLQAAKDAYGSSRSGVSSAVGAFDITQAPTSLYSDRPASNTAGGILSNLAAMASKASVFAGLLKRLVREGMPRSIVEQLAAAGPAAFDQAQALAAATPAQVLQFRKQTSLLAGAGNAAGGTVADAYYKAGVNSAQGIVNGLLSQESTLNKAIERLGNGMIVTLKHTLKIKSPSQVMHGLGQFTGEGFRQGIASKYAAIEAEGNRMGKAVHSGAAAGSDVNAGGSSGQGETHRHYHLEYMDPAAALMAIERRERLVF